MNRFLKQLAGVLAVAAGLVVLVLLVLALPSPGPTRTIYGVTFSEPHAKGLGLNWRTLYDEILEDLGVKRLRLVAYWNVIEPTDDQFDFSGLDYQMDRASEEGAEVILAVGRKVPRWPECHLPNWAKDLPPSEQQKKVLEMLEVVVARYRSHPALHKWQLENEPFLDFGDCPPTDTKFLSQEQAIVRAVDSAHPILITDSGELNSWLTAAEYGDILGTTMYRTVFSGRIQKLFHYDYIFPAWLYRLKSRYIAVLHRKDVLISELQGEPWGAKPFTEMSVAERRASFSPERFSELADFSHRTQLGEAYWWGVEYWYWEKEVNDEPIFWEKAKSLF